MIELKDLSFRYEESDKYTLKNINMKIEEGEFILLTGRSGCGKTTLIRLLNGLIPHFYPGEIKGELLLEGNSLLKRNPSELAGEIGTVFQDPRSQFFMTDTTRELAFGCENMGLTKKETIERVVKAAEDLQLKHYLNRSIFELSSGEKQQVAIGSVYAMAPKLYILDEPSANLDYKASKRLAAILRKLKNEGYTILIAEHRFYYLRDLLDRVFWIQEGEFKHIFTKAEFCEMDENIRTAYGLRSAYPEKGLAKKMKEIGVCQVSKSQKQVFEVKNLYFSYRKKTEILHNVNFYAESGDVVGILGHNGAGKTTLLSVLCGIRKEKKRAVYYNGKALSAKQRKNISYLVMQDVDYQLFGSSVEEEMTLGVEKECERKVEETLRDLELTEYKKRHPASLSGGQKQRVTIGAAIVKESALIYFDEPTSGLDYDSMLRVSKLIKSLASAGRIVFVVSHDSEFISQTCTKILELGSS